MTMPSKGRSSITVDGDVYHYRIRLNESDRGVIQHGSGQGACVFVLFPSPVLIMRPKHVADAIRHAIDNGWKRAHSGDDVWLSFETDNEDNAILTVLSTDDKIVRDWNAFSRSSRTR